MIVLYYSIPEQPIANKNAIVNFFVGLVIEDLRHSLDTYEYKQITDRLRNSSNAEMEKFYNMVLSEINNEMASFIKKSVKASYGGNRALGLSTEEKYELLNDLRKAFQATVGLYNGNSALNSGSKSGQTVQRVEQITPDSCIRKAEEALKRNDITSAISECDKAIELSDGKNYYIFEKARMLSSCGRHSDCLKILENKLPEFLKEFTETRRITVLKTLAKCYINMKKDIKTAPFIIVSSDGEGFFSSVNQAVKTIPLNQTIYILPGTYNESVIIDRDVCVEGYGSKFNITILNSNSSSLVIRANNAKISNVSLRTTEKGIAAVDIQKGKSTLESCNITSDLGNCIDIHGREASPLIKDCNISNSQEFGVFSYEGSSALIKNCNIYQNDCGVAFYNSNTIIESCSIRNNKFAGVSFTKSKGIVRDCDIYKNGKAGINIGDGSDPAIEGSRIRDNESSGIFVFGKALGSITNCKIYCNKSSNIGISDNSNPQINNCKISSSSSSGVYVYDGGRGNIIECEIYQNSEEGIVKASGGNPTINRCNIHDNNSIIGSLSGIRRFFA